MTTIQCAGCKADTPFDASKRVVCIHCGGDFGFLLLPGPDGKIHLETPPPYWYADTLGQECLGRIEAVKRLCELSQ